MLNIVLSIMMLASVLLLGGAYLLWRRGVRKQAALMIVLAVILGVNIAIWTLPDDGGTAPLERIKQSGATV